MTVTLTRADVHEIRHAEAEWCVLAALLVEPHKLQAVAKVITAASFTHSGRAGIFATLLAEQAAGRPPDQIESPIAMLRHRDVTHEDIVDLLDRITVSLGDPVRYAEAVAKRYLIRQALQTAREGLREIEAAEEPAEAMQTLGRQLVQVAASSTTRERHDFGVAELARQSLEAMERRLGGEASGLSTGLEDLDRILKLAPGRLYVVAGRPAMGKSSLAAQFVRATVRAKRWRVVSLEMEGSEWLDRLMCLEAGVDLHRHREGWLNQDEINRMYDAGVMMENEWLLRVDQQPGATMPHIASKAREWATMEGIDGLVIDYLQIVAKRDPRLSQYDHVNEVSGQCKLLARELKIPVILLSQLSRECEKRQDKRPLQSDLRDSGAIEQDADAIVMVYRDHVYNREAHPEGAEVLVRKQRNGPTGEVLVRWQGQFTRFSDWSEA